MSRTPFERAPSAGLGIPAIAIAVAVGIGYLGKRQDPANAIGGLQPPPPPDFMMPLRIQGAGTGTSLPQLSPNAVWLERFRPDPGGYAAWAKFELIRGNERARDLPGEIEFPCKDGAGETWPCDTVWDNGVVYVALPKGFTQPPKDLVATAEQSSNVVARAPFAPFSRPVPAPPPRLMPAWPGLVAEACQLLADPKSVRRVRFDAPLPDGHILLVRRVASSGSSTPSPYAWGVKGPEKGPYLQVVDSDLRYPESTATAYFEVRELKPRHVKRRIELDGLPITEKFEDPWVTGDSAVIDFGFGVKMWIHGRDTAPYRAPQKRRSVVPIDFAAQGIVFHLKSRLVSPTSIQGVPIRLEMNANGRPSFPPRSPVNDAPGRFEKIALDIEGDVYESVRKATIAVDLRRPKRTDEYMDRLIRPFRVWVDKAPAPPGYHATIPPTRPRYPIMPGLPSP